MSLAFALLASWTLVTDAHAARVEIAGVSASSYHPEQEGVSYDPQRVIDGRVRTAWVEGEEGSGLGSWIKLDLGEERQVHKVRVWGGLWSSGNFWQRANRPQRLEIRYSDGSNDVLDLEDEMKPQDFELASPKSTDSIRLRIQGIHSGTTWLDTAISQVQVFDTSPDDFAPVRNARASSVLAADADGDYRPENTLDGLVDSSWCEANRNQDGSGAWIEYQFAGPHRISEVELVNGVGGNMRQWMNANRATKGTLTFADGTTHDIEIRNAMMPQTISFPEITTDRVRLTLTEITEGQRYNDMCLSQVYFRP